VCQKKLLEERGASEDNIVRDIFLAKVLKTAFLAFRLAGCAYVSSVKDEPVVSLSSEIFRKSCSEVFLYGFYCGSF
jgi:hypothetical protein